MSEILGRATLILAVLGVRHVTLNSDRDGLLHLVADDLTRQLTRSLGLLGAHGYLLPFARRCSPATVFKRAISRRTRVKSCGFAAWPVARAMRRLNCSRRSSSSSFCRSAGDLARNSLAVLMSYSRSAVNGPGGSRTACPPTASTQP